MTGTANVNPRFLELWRIAKDFPGPRGKVSVVADFSLCVREGEFICLIGHSGCGKSTVLSIVAGLTEGSSGAVVVDNREVDGPGLDRGMVFQAPCLLPWLSAEDNVMIAVTQANPGMSRSERRKIARENLAMVGLADSVEKFPSELSGGMKQRVGIARAFALSPKVLLLDEPFGMLDCITRMELQDTLLDLWNQRRLTAFMVTHDVDEALYLADRVVMMTSGPSAVVGDILEVDFERPRNRREMLDSPRYYELRERLIGFLESEGGESDKNAPDAAPAAAAPEESEAKEPAAA